MADLTAPNHVADFLLVNSREAGEVLTNLKLQKLIYYSQAWFLALNGQALFDEEFQAWVHGPVLPSQYFRFSEFRWKPITDEVVEPVLPEAVTDHLCEVLEVFGVETAVSLEHMTHDEMPWKQARGDLDPHEPSKAIIRKDWMKEFYAQLANGGHQEAGA